MERNGRLEGYLLINRVEVLEAGECSACGRQFSPSPVGEKTLVLSLGDNERGIFFCAGCGDNIMGRAESELAKKRFAWDWTIKLHPPAQVSDNRSGSLAG